MTIKVLEAGLHSTIQDAGRHGYQTYGFAVSGPMDEFAAQIANILVYNEPDEAVIEVSFIGPTLQFHQDSIVAITGSDMSANINDQAISLARPISIKKGDILQLRTAKTGAYGYIAIQGGLKLSDVLGSKSTLVRVTHNGLLGRPLKVGDSIPLQRLSVTDPSLDWGVVASLFTYITDSNRMIRYLEGPQAEWFDVETFEDKEWQLSTHSNRMGFRLEGEPVRLLTKEQLASEATSFGAIQVPANGLPIILMADGQPTGGYPKIGQVIRADLAKVSQTRPGSVIRFQRVSYKHAIDQLDQQKQLIAALQYIMKEKWL